MQLLINEIIILVFMIQFLKILDHLIVESLTTNHWTATRMKYLQSGAIFHRNKGHVERSTSQIIDCINTIHVLIIHTVVNGGCTGFVDHADGTPDIRILDSTHNRSALLILEHRRTRDCYTHNVSELKTDSTPNVVDDTRVNLNGRDSSFLRRDPKRSKTICIFHHLRLTRFGSLLDTRIVKL